jgi:DNA-binding Lrp family transcriptional regulator
VDGWWEDIEREIVQCLERYGELSPSEIGKHVGLSEASVVSLIGVLAVGGAVRIARVAPGREGTLRRPDAA